MDPRKIRIVNAAVQIAKKTLPPGVCGIRCHDALRLIGDNLDTEKFEKELAERQAIPPARWKKTKIVRPAVLPQLGGASLLWIGFYRGVPREPTGGPIPCVAAATHTTH